MEACRLPGAMSDRTVFVTVGTTSFDRLVETVSHANTIQVLKNRGYTRVLFQVGRGSARPPKQSPVAGVDLEWYDFKPGLGDDIRAAALVIGHAGAGTVTETLEANRPMVVVVNDRLMNNHQLELAQQMQDDNHLVHCTCNNLIETLSTVNPESFAPYRQADATLFGRYLDGVLQTSTPSQTLVRGAVQLAALAGVIAFYWGL